MITVLVTTRKLDKLCAKIYLIFTYAVGSQSEWFQRFTSFCNNSLDIGRKLNICRTFWTSYVRWTYFLCPGVVDFRYITDRKIPGNLNNVFFLWDISEYEIYLFCVFLYLHSEAHSLVFALRGIFTCICTQRHIHYPVKHLCWIVLRK